MKVAVSEFKAKCNKLFSTVEGRHETIEITRHGKIIDYPPCSDYLTHENG